MSNNDILRIYEIYLEDLRNYNNIIWQFPTALVTVNILGLHFLNNHLALFFISIINFVMIHAYFKHIHLQRAIINALKRIEEELRKNYDSKMIPDFDKGKPWYLKPRSSLMAACGLLFTNTIFLIYNVWTLLR